MQFSTNETVQALCRTLFYSLWQGLLLAIAGGIVVLLTKKLRAAVRYNILTALLVVFLMGTGFTFCYQLSSIWARATIVETSNIPVVALTGNFGVAPPSALPIKPTAFTTVALSWLTANAGYIVIGWLLAIAFRCMQMLTGLRGIYLLRHKGLTDAGTYWVNRLNQLATSIQLTKPVLLMQSAIAKVPMVTGHLKPIILMPLGVLTALPEDEIEAILLHELAHIRRKDYLINILQSLCEIIFFFNPAVLWVSSLIKDERENCCDDIAVGNVKNKQQFIHALISFQEYHLAATNYAVGFPGRKNHLLNRVKRIITNNNKTLNTMEKTLLATGIVILSFITVAFTHAKQTPKDAKKAGAKQISPAAKENNTNFNAINALELNGNIGDTMTSAISDFDNDTTKAKKQHGGNYFGGNGTRLNFTTVYEGKEYKIVQDDDTITTLFVDGERIPNNKIAQYKPIIKKIKEGLKAAQEKQFAWQEEQFKQQEEQFSKQQIQFTAQQKEFAKQQEQLQRALDTTQIIQFKQQQEKLKTQFSQQEEQFKEQEKQFIKQKEELHKQRITFNRMLRDSDKYFIIAPMPPQAPIPPLAPMQTITFTPSAPKAPLPPVAPMHPAPIAPLEPTAPMAPIPPVAPVAPAPPVESKSVKEIISLLKSEGIITNTDDFSFTLNNTELIVNNVRQPEALQKMLKEKYLTYDGDHIKYKTKKKYNGTETITDIHTSKTKQG